MKKPLKEKILSLYKEDMSIREIAKELNISKSTVQYNLNKHNEYHKYKEKKELYHLPKDEKINKEDYKKCIKDLQYEKDNFPRPNDKKEMSKKALAQYYNQMYVYDFNRKVNVLIKGITYTEDMLKIFPKE